jgi:hypothetical protein
MKTLVGLVVVLVAILGIIWYARRDDSFLSNILNKNSQNEEEMTEEIVIEDDEVSSVVTPSSDQLLTCTQDILVQDCSTAEKQPVCSYDTVMSGKGNEQSSRTEYISACHYCKFFGADGIVDFSDEQLVTKGYTVGPCN